MGIGTFGTFTQARLAIYAAQSGIQVTGNNISNVNTAGYTRQRLNQVSLYTAGSDRYYAEGSVRIGQGALVKSVSQIRSPYLDIRYRQENAKVGFADEKLGGLDRIAQILDEVGKGDESKDEEGFGVLGLEINKLFGALADLTDQTGHQEYDNTVRGVAENLVNKFHTYANQLQQEYDGTVQMLHNNVDKVNDILDTLRSLNEEIRQCEIHGDNALEIRDERNRQLDELSSLIDIDVTYSMEKIAAGVEVEKMTVRLGNANPDATVRSDETTLVDGIYSAHLVLEQVPEARWTKAELAELQANDAGKADPTIWPYKDAADNLTEFQYRMADGTLTNDATTGGQANTKNDINKDYEGYVKGDGTYTSSPKEARQVDNPNFNMMVTALRNSKGEPQYHLSRTDLERTLASDPAMTADKRKDFEALIRNGAQEGVDGNGNPTVTIYRKAAIYDHGNIVDYAYYKEVYQQVPSAPVYLDDNDLNGGLQAQRELLTEKGEFVDTNVISNDPGNSNDPYRVGDESAGSKRGIPYYQYALDLMANQLAKLFNDANQGFRTDPYGNYITEEIGADGKGTGKAEFITLPDSKGDDYKLNSDAATKEGWEKLDAAVQAKLLADTGMTYDPKANNDKSNAKEIIDAYLKLNKMDAQGKPVVDENGNTVTNGIFDGGILFSNNGETDEIGGITAANISISHVWQTSHILVQDFKCPIGETKPASAASDNLLHMSYLGDKLKIDFVPSDLDAAKGATKDIMFSGTIFEMWNQIGDTLGEDQNRTGTMLDTHYENALTIDTSRDSISAVDFNDEAMNLMMYSKSYNAACRLMTTIESVIDKLINGTGLTT